MAQRLCFLVVAPSSLKMTMICYCEAKLGKQIKQNALEKGTAIQVCVKFKPLHNALCVNAMPVSIRVNYPSDLTGLPAINEITVLSKGALLPIR